MKKERPFLLYLLFFTALVLVLFLIMQPLMILKFKEKIDFLFPKGIIAVKERNLLIIIQAIMLLVILPVYFLTFLFSWKYRAAASKEKYDPTFNTSHVAEIIWWGIPLVLTLVIAALTWVKTHELDPYKPLDSDVKPLTVQVVALQWKWLFIYPEEKIATINYLQIPVNVPIRFEITADAPMNSFWIPALGGQIYAMAGMKTELNLIAQEEGDFRGSSAHISGEGFAGMHFVVRASSAETFETWVKETKKSLQSLDFKAFNELVKPTLDVPPETFVLSDENLFFNVVMKYMHPQKK